MSALLESSIVFGLATLGTMILGSISSQLTLPVMVNCWEIPHSNLQWGLGIYALWNAINDPLFAFIQDGGLSGGSAPGKQQKRLARCILLGALPFGLAFLLPWFDWGSLRPYQYFSTQFLFDGCFTFVVLAQCGLFAELEASQRGRVWLLCSQSIASLAGAGISWWAVNAVTRRNPPADASESSSGIDCDGLHALRIITIVLALVAVACFVVASLVVLADDSPKRAMPLNLSTVRSATAPRLGAAQSAGSSSSTSTNRGGAMIAGTEGSEIDGSAGRSRPVGLSAQGLAGRRRQAAGAADEEDGMEQMELVEEGAAAADGKGGDEAQDRDEDGNSDDIEDGDGAMDPEEQLVALLSAWGQVLMQPAFVTFVIVNFLQIAQMTANSAFAADFLPIIGSAAASRGLAASSMGLEQQELGVQGSGAAAKSSGWWLSSATTVSVAQGAGPVATLMVLPVVWRLGHSYGAIRLLLVLQAVVAILFGLVLSVAPLATAGALEQEQQQQPANRGPLVGIPEIDDVVASQLSLAMSLVPQAEWVPHVFVILHRALCGCAFALFGMAVSDVAERDAEIHERPNKITTSVFALNALVTKPAESVAPMIVLGLLAPLGYGASVAAASSGAGSGEGQQGEGGEASGSHEGLAGGMWFALWGSAAFASCLQLLVWQCYPLKGGKRRGGPGSGSDSEEGSDSGEEEGHKGRTGRALAHESD